MKIFNKLFVLLLVIGFASCESYIGGDINADPDNPVTVPVAAQLPSIQINLADVYGGAFSRFNSMLVQQSEGVARQWASFNQYTGLTPNRFDAAWNNVYENVLNEIKIAKASAEADGNNHYLGVLLTMEAFTLQAATDQWGDMPYSEALQGIDVPSPAYDAQEAVYSVVYSNLERALSLFAGAPGAVVPGGEDQFFGGDIAAWTAAAHAIRARGWLKTDNPNKAASEAKEAMASAAGNLAFQYPDASAAGQWYRFNRDRTGDLELHPQFRELLQSNNDTLRLNMVDAEFTTSHPYLISNFYQELVTYREMQFIIAEAAVREGGSEEGYEAYLNGIRASFSRLGLITDDNDDAYQEYLTQDGVDPGMGNLTLETVMTQKYIAMFLQPEAYSDFRRTDIPNLTPVSGNSVPVRWDYSSSEYLFNTNSPAEGDINIRTDKVGWDQ